MNDPNCVTAHRTKLYPRTARNIRTVNAAIAKLHGQTVRVRRSLMTRLRHMAKELASRKTHLYDPRDREFKVGHDELREAMAHHRESDSLAKALVVIALVQKHIEGERAMMSDLRPILHNAEVLKAQCRRIEDRTLCSLKRAATAVACLDSGPPPIFLSKETVDPALNVPPDDIAAIAIDAEGLDKIAMDVSEAGVATAEAMNEAVGIAERAGAAADAAAPTPIPMVRFKSVYDKARVRQLPEVVEALEREGMQGLTDERRDVILVLYNKCVRANKNNRRACRKTIEWLDRKQQEIDGFFLDVQRQLEIVRQPVETSHDIIMA